MWWRGWVVIWGLPALCGCGNGPEPPNLRASDAGTGEIAQPPSQRESDAGRPDIACPTARFTEDRDGDGVAANYIVSCRGLSVAPPSAAASDCDDSDPTRFQLARTDADGDGYVTGEPQCIGKLSAGYGFLTYSNFDCDDHDATVQLFAYDDLDGDGYGSTSKHCIPAQLADAALPKGVVRDPSDCDDHDPLIHPGAFEQWHDGVDSDCDGRDDPLSCDVPASSAAADAGQDRLIIPPAIPACGCELLDTPGVAVEPGCKGTDLFVVQQQACFDCIGHNLVVIGNRGASATSGGYDLLLGDEPTSLHVNQDLDSGAVSLPLVLEGSGKTLRIISPDGCEPNAPPILLPQSQSTCLTP